MLNTESVYFFIFVFSTLVLLNFSSKFLRALLLTNPKPFVMSDRELIILASSISYVITYLVSK
jgi:hypothetical protein